jgi:hypothetical protein
MQFCRGYDQGDQIGRFLAHWVIVNFGHFLKIAKVGHIFGLFSTVKGSILSVTKNGFGYILGDFFPTHLVTLATTTFTSPQNKSPFRMAGSQWIDTLLLGTELNYFTSESASFICR